MAGNLTKTQMIAYALLIISIIILGSSSYGTGKNDGDKTSLGYRVASSFMIIGVVVFLISLGMLFFSDFLGSSCNAISNSFTSGFNTSGAFGASPAQGAASGGFF